MVLNRPLTETDQTQIEALTENLVREWRDPHDQGEPVIIKEEGPHGQPLRIYVVWSQWANLTQRERSGIVMRAAEEVGGAELAYRITLAMGLTTTEAARLGIETS
jgi:hypothetical protein